MDWTVLTELEREQFCERHSKALWGLFTCLEWNELSPTSQLLLKEAGITNKAIYER
jgi:hypothetical protein